MEIAMQLQRDLDAMDALFDQIDKLERIHKHLEEMANIERVRRECEAVWRLTRTAVIEMQRTLNHSVRRIQCASGGKGKTSAKRKSSSSGGGSSGDGGDGGGDSDGPQRPPSKPKKTVLQKAATRLSSIRRAILLAKLQTVPLSSPSSHPLQRKARA